jgi:UDP-N-acetylglucosamine--N-acetylmuramyl-(pentapeptide) pyrophosphoryl-undecaprenol N-acetylglucosamine transferase
VALRIHHGARASREPGSTRSSRIVFAGGGTGGHLYPALAVADELRARRPQASIEFVGARRGIERRLVPAAGYPLRLLRLSGLQGAGAIGRVRAAAEAGWAIVRCVGWMLARRPDLVVGVGGYASGPAVLAARILGVKTMILEQNHWPGATNRWLAPRVHAVAVPSEEARRALGGIGTVTGNPVRRAFFDIGPPPASDPPTILVFGGSRGAASLNRAMARALPTLASLAPPPRIVHQTGADDEAFVRGAYARYPAASEVAAYFDDMPARLAAAGLVVCRAGATTLAELAAAGRPAILVPYPHAAEDHQRRNAETVERAGAAVTIADAALEGPALADALVSLVGDSARRERMARAARALARSDATAAIADVAEQLVDGREP